MANDAELASLRRWLIDTVDRVVAVAGGMDAEQLNWRPPAAGTNSVYVLVSHVMGNVEQGVLTQVCAVEPSTRDRDAEFAASGQSAQPLGERWRAVRARVSEALEAFDPGALDSPCSHPVLGDVQARDLLINMIHHAAQHLAHAELTRDLARAAAPAAQ